MTTLREYLDTLSGEARRWLAHQCSFIDLDSEDGYNHFDESDLNSIYEKAFAMSKDDSLFGNDYIKCIMALLTSKTDGKFNYKPDMPLEERYDLLENFLVNAFGSYLFNNSVAYALPIERLRKLKEKMLKEDEKDNISYKYPLKDLLYITKDFSNIDWTKLSFSDIAISSEVFEIVPREIIKEYMLHRATAVSPIQLNIDDDTFDELFFGDDGWTESQKKDVIERYYTNDINSFDDFLKRIIAVDKSYLKYLPKLINGKSTIYSKIYSRKKDTNDPTYSTKFKYRYSTEIRQLIWALRCCEYKMLRAKDTPKLGNLAPLLKIYGLDFANLISMLYEQPTQDNTEAEVTV